MRRCHRQQQRENTRWPSSDSCCSERCGPIFQHPRSPPAPSAGTCRYLLSPCARSQSRCRRRKRAQEAPRRVFWLWPLREIPSSPKKRDRRRRTRHSHRGEIGCPSRARAATETGAVVEGGRMPVLRAASVAPAVRGGRGGGQGRSARVHGSSATAMTNASASSTSAHDAPVTTRRDHTPFWSKTSSPTFAWSWPFWNGHPEPSTLLVEPALADAGTRTRTRSRRMALRDNRRASSSAGRSRHPRAAWVCRPRTRSSAPRGQQLPERLGDRSLTIPNTERSPKVCRPQPATSRPHTRNNCR